MRAPLNRTPKLRVQKCASRRHCALSLYFTTRLDGAPLNAAISLLTSLSIWMAGWNLSPATKCGNISRHARLAWHFSATCAPPLIGAALSRFHVTRPSRVDCAPSLHGNTSVCWLSRARKKHPQLCNESPSLCLSSNPTGSSPGSLSRNRIDGDEVESEFSCLSVK